MSQEPAESLFTVRQSVLKSIRKRVSFDGPGIVGHGRPAGPRMGELDVRFHLSYLTAVQADDFYAVRSQDTPIAWYANGEWAVPDDPDSRHNPIARAHRALVREALNPVGQSTPAPIPKALASLPATIDQYERYRIAHEWLHGATSRDEPWAGHVSGQELREFAAWFIFSGHQEPGVAYLHWANASSRRPVAEN